MPIIKRRELLTMSIAGAVMTALGGVALGRNGPRFLDSDSDAAFIYDENRKFANTSFGRIAYIDRGIGPAALFLHGFPLNSFQWRGVIDALLPQRRCIAPDFMGLGYTEVSDGQEVTPSAQVDMLVAFLDKLGIDQVDLLANDSGGAIAQLFLVKHQKRVRTLLLTNCDVETQSPPPAMFPIIELARLDVYANLLLVSWADYKDKARSLDGLGGICYSNPAHPSDVALEQYLRPLIASERRKALVQRYALGLAPNPLEGVSSLLRTCEVPTRIVWGMADTIFSPQNADYLASILPQVTGVRRLRRAKLFFPEEYPELVAEEARRLWNISAA
jgi:haloalkane dehalogenase